MKIIIVGAGVAGLSTYLQLRHTLPSLDSHDITIYESHPPDPRQTRTQLQASDGVEATTDSTAVVGNSIALSPASVRLLRSISPEAYTLFRSRGYSNAAFTFRTARGHTLATIPTDDGSGPSEGAVSCPRHVLRDVLLEVVGAERVAAGKVVDVELEGRRPVVVLADGARVEGDLVVGADGVRSAVKRAVLGREEDERLYGPRHEGFLGVGAFTPTHPSPLPTTITAHKSMVFTFGPSGSFGYCSASASGDTIGWWSNWGHDEIPSSNVADPKEIQRQLLSRHGTWADPVIKRCIASSTTDRVYPIWTTPELPFWGRRAAVLLGDAAHTLQATSGAGAGQALEDAVVFTELLAGYLRGEEKGESGVDGTGRAIDRASSGLYAIRNPRVKMVRERARNLYLSKKRIESVVVEYLYYAFIFLCTRFPVIGQLIIGTVFKETHGWDPRVEVEKYLQSSAER